MQHKYRQVMDLLRQDLLNNEKECKKIQEQIEWVSRRRAELNSEVRNGEFGALAIDFEAKFC